MVVIFIDYDFYKIKFTSSDSDFKNLGALGSTISIIKKDQTSIVPAKFSVFAKVKDNNVVKGNSQYFIAQSNSQVTLATDFKCKNLVDENESECIVTKLNGNNFERMRIKENLLINQSLTALENSWYLINYKKGIDFGSLNNTTISSKTDDSNIVILNNVSAVYYGDWNMEGIDYTIAEIK